MRQGVQDQVITDVREVRATVVAGGVVLAYTLLVLASGAVDPADYAHLLLSYLRASFALWAVVGMAGALVLLVRNARRGPDGLLTSPLVLLARDLSERWQRDRFASLLWPPVLFAMLMASFNAFKQMILPGAGFGYDPLFAAIDHALFLGHDPWRITHAVLPPFATLAIDRAYHGWFAPMSLGVLLCAWASRDSYRLRTQYLLSYIAVWIGLGSGLAYLVPAAGPCFDSLFGQGAAGFQPLVDALAHDQAATGAKFSALANQAGLFRAFGAHTLVPGAGISAMPSVHNALSVLFAIAGFRIHRVLGWALSGFAAMIWIGSIHLGWHYAIDGIVGAALTLAIWHLAGRVAARLEQPLLFSRTAAAALA